MGLHFSKEEFSKRKIKVLQSMKEQNLDALLMFRQESIKLAPIESIVIKSIDN